MGQRSTTETLAGIYQAFLAKRTWRQPELAKELGVSVEALRRVLFELMEKGMPLERDEEERSRVYWSVPSDWFPESVLFKREEVPELLRQLRRAPQGPGRKRLLDLVLARLPRAKISEAAVVPASSRPEEEQFLDVVEQSASEQVTLAMRYFTGTGTRPCTGSCSGRPRESSRRVTAAERSRRSAWTASWARASTATSRSAAPRTLRSMCT